MAVFPLSETKYYGISKVEKLMIKALDRFTGFFEYVIYCNNFSYFDDFQAKLESERISFKNRFLYNILILELGRIHVGIDNYSSYENAIKYFQPSYLQRILHDPDYFPDVVTISYALRVIPLIALTQYFFQLFDKFSSLKSLTREFLFGTFNSFTQTAAITFTKR